MKGWLEMLLSGLLTVAGLGIFGFSDITRTQWLGLFVAACVMSLGQFLLGWMLGKRSVLSKLAIAQLPSTIPRISSASNATEQQPQQQPERPKIAIIKPFTNTRPKIPAIVEVVSAQPQEQPPARDDFITLD